MSRWPCRPSPPRPRWRRSPACGADTTFGPTMTWDWRWAARSLSTSGLSYRSILTARPSRTDLPDPSPERQRRVRLDPSLTLRARIKIAYEEDVLDTPALLAIDTAAQPWEERFNEKLGRALYRKELVKDPDTGMEVRLVRYPA